MAEPQEKPGLWNEHRQFALARELAPQARRDLNLSATGQLSNADWKRYVARMLELMHERTG